MAPTMAILSSVIFLLSLVLVTRAVVNNMRDVYKECESRVKDKYCVGSNQKSTDFPGDGCLYNKNCEIVVLALKNGGAPTIYIAHLTNGTKAGAKRGGDSFVAFTNNVMEWKPKDGQYIKDDLVFADGTTYFHVDTDNVESPGTAQLMESKPSSDGLVNTDITPEIVNQFDDTSKGFKYTLARFQMKGMVIHNKTNLNQKVVLSASNYYYDYQSNGKFVKKDPGFYQFATRISDIPPSKIWEADYSSSKSANLTWLWVILAIAFILLLILLIWCLVRRKKQPKPVSGTDSEATLRSKMPSGSAVSRNPGTDAKSAGSKAAGASATGTSTTSTSATGATSASGSKSTSSKATSSKTGSKTSKV